MDATTDGSRNPDREKLLLMLMGYSNTTNILVKNIFPKFVKVTNRATATPVTQLMIEGGNIYTFNTNFFFETCKYL